MTFLAHISKIECLSLKYILIYLIDAKALMTDLFQKWKIVVRNSKKKNTHLEMLTLDRCHVCRRL